MSCEVSNDFDSTGRKIKLILISVIRVVLTERDGRIHKISKNGMRQRQKIDCKKLMNEHSLAARIIALKDIKILKKGT